MPFGTSSINIESWESSFSCSYSTLTVDDITSANTGLKQTLKLIDRIGKSINSSSKRAPINNQFCAAINKIRLAEITVNFSSIGTRFHPQDGEG